MTKPSFKKNISTFGLLMTGLTSIIGSGWLLGTQKISEIAGPAGLLAWVIGMLVALLVGLFFIEVGTSFPSAGGIGYYSNVTHGHFCGFLTAWINWLSILAVPPVEAQSIVQYVSKLTPSLQAWYDVPTHALSHSGIVVALLLMFLFMYINYWSVQLFIRFNNFITLLKIIVPFLTIGALVYTGLHASNFAITHWHTFAPYGVKAIFVSVISSGVLMSFNGFQSPLNFSEEIADPKRMLPIAVVGSIVIAFVIYILLQIVFIGSINPLVIVQNTWSAINYRSPYIDLLMLTNLHLIIFSIYAAAVISPGATGVAYVASSARILYSLSKEKHLPLGLSKIHPHYLSPRNAVVCSCIVGACFLFICKGWYQLVAVISVLHVFSYVPAAVIALANRKMNPNAQSAYHVPCAVILGPFLLFVLSILLFNAAWPLTGELIVLMSPGLVFYFYYDYKFSHWQDFRRSFKGALWLIYYMIGISVITYLGDNSMIGHNILNVYWSMALLALLSISTCILGVKLRLRSSLRAQLVPQ